MVTAMTSVADEPKVGDWIRFMHGGRLVIDEVAYLVPRSPYDSTVEAHTIMSGQVSFEWVVELRRAGRKDSVL